jgi:hypothetical protein
MAQVLILGQQVLYWAGIIALVVRLVESIYQLRQDPEVKSVLGKVWLVIQNFLLKLETYKKKA